ncbi:NAD(P)/FAD-dependent oxidoreductase [Bacillus sp. 165]|uniref:flavin monoamine oxidase family protein n=1 Tax=Bacillus sp. 165 TaxID=1529117 RepID=UPI001ADAEA8E|nr:NAD(P)/FAD-dependent oxidoreductase [Bacillus sp. 165]MBO9128791.1 FAD-dependent oxidoreductase [Bacillus sp. 165]
MARTPLTEILRNTYVEMCKTFEKDISYNSINHGECLENENLSPNVIVPQVSIPPSNSFLPSNTLISPKVVIVGAGLAGLTCAYRLKQAGIVSTVYEANHQVGGRCSTRRGDFSENQIVERGGTLIDTEHEAILRLCHELGLQIDNLHKAEAKGTQPCYYFNGQAYSFDEVTQDFKQVFHRLQKDLRLAAYPTLYNRFTKRGFELDHMSIRDWINENVPGGINSKFGHLLDVAYNIEYGAESKEQSALNLIYLLGFSRKRPFQIFGSSDERFHIRGGNDQISTILSKTLENQIVTGTRLIAIKENYNGTYTLTFQSETNTFDVNADKVVLTIPFSVLRTSVDYSKAGLRPLKIKAIEELGMGTNTKLHVQFHDRHWHTLGCNGETFADRGYQNTFEASRAQAGNSGILVNYTGGAISKSLNGGTPQEQAERFLMQCEPVLPGISSKWNGMVTRDEWLDNPFALGSYSYWKVGQYTTFAGIEGEREGTKGNLHFAGEHTSIEFQGYLNGAAESGERAAQEILGYRTP